MPHKPHAFENQIFEHFREKEKAINKAVEFLQENGIPAEYYDGRMD